ncbi:response regulator [Thiobacillus sp.]|uniref:response regulator n=1 Tax=Thiobacillus sp. TaxID=924 RepID=UPI0025DE5EC4|nr:response regulator [Thiobacillus sp.]MBT9541053.1 response regulator [Thiobacillus sp.]
MPAIDRMNEDVVLIVDDVPENLSLLYDALDEAGYAVLVATNGESALQRARQSLPDVILLDAVMPGMDGFEVARQLKADADTQRIPIIFMTGLTETEHVVAAFAAGSTDYLTKPIRPSEVLARIAAHVQSARQTQQARSVLDAYGQACVSMRPTDGALLWQTPLARTLLLKYGGPDQQSLVSRIHAWLHIAVASPPPPATLEIMGEEGRMVCALHGLTEEGECLLVLHEESDAAMTKVLVEAFRLTLREAEVLYWVIYGKTNRDIGDILGISHRTINKHLENLFEKLGVETRTAAAAVAMRRLQLPAQTETKKP